MIFFLALRNITRNKKNSAIIALLIAVITFLFFIGNSITGKAERTVRRAYIESLTGDVVLQKAGDITMNLFGANTPIIENYFTIPVLPAHDAVMELAATEAGVAGITSQVSGSAFLDMSGLRDRALLCGVDASTYFPLFPGAILEEGRYLQSGEHGAMITVERAQKIESKTGSRPAIGTPMLLTSGGEAGFRIREVPLVGIFRYENPGHFMNEIIIIDAQTVRALNSIQVAGSVDVGEDALRLLAADPDDLFGEAFYAAGTEEQPEFSADMLWGFLSGPGAESVEEKSGGDWNFIILRLEKGRSVSAFISSLNKKISSYGVVAVNWRVADGVSAILMLLVQALYNAGVFLVGIVGVITVINIFLIAVFRRTREIGTLRAIGASDKYIRSLILSENLFLAVAAGLAGVLGGLAFLRWINSLGFYISNSLLASILGGSVLQLDFLPYVAVFSFAVAVVLGLTASVYPVEMAVRIEPMVAVRRG